MDPANTEIYTYLHTLSLHDALPIYFGKPLPAADKLKAQLIKFHKAHGSDADKKLFKNPKLIDLLEEELIPSSYFKTWRDVPEVQQYCRDMYHDFLMVNP